MLSLSMDVYRERKRSKYLDLVSRRLTTTEYRMVLAFCVLGILFAGLFSVGVGRMPIAFSDVLRAIQEGLESGFDRLSAPAFIVLKLRLPRVVLALIVGSMLAMAGATLQSLMKSALADPFVLGISSGAAMGAALATALGLAAWGGALTVNMCAFGTALFAVWLVYRAARSYGPVSALRLVLAGVAVNALCGAVTGLLLFLVERGDDVRGLMMWLLGGFDGSDWPKVVAAIVVGLPSAIVLWVLSPWQDLLLLGDEAASALGLDVERARARLVLLASLMTAVSVACAGVIGFVGLLVPHAIRPFTGPGHRRLLPLGALVGALFLLTMDTLARTALSTREVPVGILTGVIGAPIFLLLLSRQAESRRGN